MQKTDAFKRLEDLYAALRTAHATTYDIVTEIGKQIEIIGCVPPAGLFTIGPGDVIVMEPKITPFDQFWALYPKKKGKGDAKKAWDKLKVGPQLFSQIMIAVEAQCRWPEWKDIDFVPHPATWLRAEEWLDEPSPRARKAGEKSDVPVEKTRWDRVLEYVAIGMGRHDFETWFGNTRMIKQIGAVVTVSVKMAEQADWIRRHYEKPLRAAVDRVYGTDPLIGIVFRVVPEQGGKEVDNYAVTE